MCAALVKGDGEAAACRGAVLGGYTWGIVPSASPAWSAVNREEAQASLMKGGLVDGLPIDSTFVRPVGRGKGRGGERVAGSGGRGDGAHGSLIMVWGAVALDRDGMHHETCQRGSSRRSRVEKEVSGWKQTEPQPSDAFRSLNSASSSILAFLSLLLCLELVHRSCCSDQACASSTCALCSHLKTTPGRTSSMFGAIVAGRLVWVPIWLTVCTHQAHPTSSRRMAPPAVPISY